MDQPKRKRVLVAWGSKMGGTEGIAHLVGETLERAGVDVVLQEASLLRDASGFDAVIIGGALYAHRWHRDARRFVMSNVAGLRQVPVWFFSSGPLGDTVGDKDLPPAPQVTRMIELIGALGHVTFGGRLPADAKGFPAAAMAKTLSGDWRNPERIRAWAGEIAAALAEAKPGIATRSEVPHRKLVMTLALFAAISAMAGGVELFLWPNGNRYLPLALIEHTPFSSFLVPSLLLGVIVGGSSLACALLAQRRAAATVDATLLAGGALSVWIAAESAMMRDVHWLHIGYGGLGIALLGLGLVAARRSGAARHRWVTTVTTAEALGYLAPASVGILSAKAGLNERASAALVVGAGMVEGLALGVGQAWAFPCRIRRARYAGLTGLGAAVVWASVMLLVSGRERLPAGVAPIAGAGVALVGLAAIGSVQWLELRAHVRSAHRWIAWTALAWALALPFSFAPGPFVDESTPLASHLVLWGCGGLLMAYVMTLITWQGVRRIGCRRDRFAMEAEASP